ncbi:DinB family protein [Paenibacillus sp. 598K]|uniref:DinB family protein n=1 Tax=Paenibacillus sp. 598K TaxID=1117987 RepID=UPI000FFB0595|nr:DinB family protein [Paenibacillus sp. 598K]GBF78432.1 DinB family protein [Paenibacillus sp. 598K]
MSHTEYEATIAAYVDVYREIEHELDGATADQLAWKAAPGSWSVTEVLAHLVDHSLVVSFRLREILSGSSVRLPAFDQDAWVAGQRANDYSAGELLVAAHALVAFNAALLARLTDEEWQRSGINAVGATVTIADAISAFVRHVDTHLAQIRRIKQALPEELAS